MIQLSKGQKPRILVANELQWTAALLNKLSTGEIPTNNEKTRYRHPEIKTELISETNGKCAYCESKLLHIHHGDVEHIYPKSLDPAKTFEWDNLTLACEICNQNKSNKDPYLEHIIDPYESDPSDHLLFTGPLIFPRGTPEGESTRILLDLNRGELSERRKEHLEKIMAIVNTVMRPELPLATRRAIFSDLCNREGHAAAPYTAMVKSLIDQITPHLPISVTS